MRRPGKMDDSGAQMNKILKPSMQLAATSDILSTLDPEKMEAGKGTIPTLQSSCQCTQELMSCMRQIFAEEIEKGNQKLLKDITLLFNEGRRTLNPPAVKDEMEKANPKMAEEAALTKLIQNPSSGLSSLHGKSPASRSLKLHFREPMPDSVVTFEKLQTKVELCDCSGKLVENINPGSPTTVEIFGLMGDFDFEDNVWTAKDFDDKVVQRRKLKGDLLKGKCKVQLIKGVAQVEDICFTDNSMRCETFRLGARVKQGLPDGVQVRDAVSTRIRVIERRARYNTLKSLSDPTYHLKHIGTVRSKELADKNINTAMDLLQLYHADKDKLEPILRLSEDQWSELTKDAERFVPGEFGYIYRDSGFTLLLDCVFNIKKVTDKDGGSVPYPRLNDSAKEDFNKMRRIAYEKRSMLERTPTSIAAYLSTVDSPPKSQDLSLNLKAPSLISPTGNPETNRQQADATVVQTTKMTNMTTWPCGSPAIGEKGGSQLIHNPFPDQMDQGGLLSIGGYPHEGAPAFHGSQVPLSLSLQPSTAPHGPLFTASNPQTEPLSTEACAPVGAVASRESQGSPSLSLQPSTVPPQFFTASNPQTGPLEGYGPGDVQASHESQGSPSMAPPCQRFTASNPQMDMRHSDATAVADKDSPEGSQKFSVTAFVDSLLNDADLTEDNQHTGELILEDLNNPMPDCANAAADLGKDWLWATEAASHIPCSQTSHLSSPVGVELNSGHTGQLGDVNGKEAMVSVGAAEELMSQGSVESKRRRLG